MTLARGLSERDARDLGAELNRRGVAATRRAEGAYYAIQVSESAVADAWGAVHGERSQAATQPAASAPLLTTREAELRAEESRLDARLGAAIARLPHVRSATVLTTLPRPDASLSDLRASPASGSPRVLVALSCDGRGACPTQAQLHTLLVAALPDLPRDHLRLVQQIETDAEAPCAELGHVGPLTVTRTSLPTLKLWFAASLVVHMLGSLALLLMVRRR